MHRWESLGQLAGGVAHDFNNLMGGVLGYATLAREQLPADAPTQEFLKPIQDAALHASSLCQQLLIFAGKGTSARGTIDLAELVQSTTDLVRMSVPKLIELRIQLEEGLPPIEGDASQLKQVLLNLVWNAADAISTEGGVIEVRTGAGHRSCAVTGRGHECTTLPGSDYAWFEVRDTGCGIADAALERIFEPFYSTKDQGRGLGLSAVAGIVRSHGGGLCVTSRVGAGTTIRAYLIANATGTNRMTRSESQTAPAIPHLETQAREMYAMSGGLA
jgi:signal transduction histidine kinase